MKQPTNQAHHHHNRHLSWKRRHHPQEAEPAHKPIEKWHQDHTRKEQFHYRSPKCSKHRLVHHSHYRARSYPASDPRHSTTKNREHNFAANAYHAPIQQSSHGTQTTRLISYLLKAMWLELLLLW